MHRAVLRSKAYRTLVLVVVVAVGVTATITLLGNRADAAITTAFSSRFEANVNGSIVLRGNTNRSPSRPTPWPPSTCWPTTATRTTTR